MTALTMIFKFTLLVLFVNLSHQQFNTNFNTNTNPNQQQQQSQFPNANQQQQQQQSQFPNQQFPNQQFPNQQFQSPTQKDADGNLQQTIYQFIKSNPRTTRFAELVDRVSQVTVQSLVNVLSASDGQASGRAGYSGLTVFVPINEAITQVPNDIDTVRNDLQNLVVPDRLNLDSLRQLNGQNISKTLGYKPRLVLRTVRNFYLSNKKDTKRKKRQAVYPPVSFQTTSSTFAPNLPNSLSANSFVQTNDSSAYDMYAQKYPNLSQDVASNSPISAKLPYDEVFLLNNALVIDMFELSNGIVYLINSYPRFYDKSLLFLITDNDVNGLGQNLNYWIARAAQSYRLGDENLKNALNAYGPNTYFLPVDSALNKFNDRDKLNNNTFLFDQLFKSHRVSNRILFDYYLDDFTPTVYTDTGLPVVTKHTRVNNQDQIEISIGHVKGRILPEFRNIYCASGVFHLVDTVLAIPGRNAYQEISTIQELSTFRSLIDRNQKYRQLLDQTPSQALYTTRPNAFAPRTVRPAKRQIMTNNMNPNMNNSSFSNNMFPNNNNQFGNQLSGQQQFGAQNNMNQFYNQQSQFNANNVVSDFKLLTILAPTDSAFIAIKDELMRNDSAIEEFLSNHLIVDNNANRAFYTDHDDSVFQNSQSYSTMNPSFTLTAKVTQDGASNQVTLSLANNQAIRTTITNGNSRVSNGVIHIVDRALTSISTSDIASLLEKYASQNTPNQPAFNQFVEALRSTGIFNELKEPSKKYTLFIPTNDALSRYQDIINSNDMDKKKKLLYRHICMDQNLQSNVLQTNQVYQDLICRNLLGQDLTLTKDENGLVSKWKDNAQSKILNDFSGVYSSAYVLEEPLLNNQLPNYGLNNLNSSSNRKFSFYIFSICLTFILFLLSN